jgi:hypothetical protein
MFVLILLLLLREADFVLGFLTVFFVDAGSKIQAKIKSSQRNVFLDVAVCAQSFPTPIIIFS